MDYAEDPLLFTRFDVEWMQEKHEPGLSKQKYQPQIVAPGSRVAMAPSSDGHIPCRQAELQVKSRPRT